eukprot:9932409-Alexandrium_andersonii.AAC.1
MLHSNLVNWSIQDKHVKQRAGVRLGDAVRPSSVGGGIADPRPEAATWTRRPAQQAAAGPEGFQAPWW